MSLYLTTFGIFLNISHFSLGFRFEQAQGEIDDSEDTVEEETETPEDTSLQNIYEGPTFTRLTPDSTYGM